MTDHFRVRPIGADDLARIVLDTGGSFMQTPQWAGCKPDWRAEHLGWFDAADQLVGGALLLSRSIPRTRKSFAYVADGPALPWARVAHNPSAWLDPLVAHAKAGGAFALRLGAPMPIRIWSPARVKEAMAAGGLLAFTDIPADRVEPDAVALADALVQRGWTKVGWDTAAAVGQPRFICVLDLAGRGEADVLKVMNQQWRRNIKKADKVGVQVRDAGRDGVAAFHALYRETAVRDGFVPRERSYFESIMASFAGAGADGEQGAAAGITARIYEAAVDGDVLASALMITVGPICSYLYGGSTSRNREARASNAVQWAAIRDALADGCTGYDFRGFNTSLGADSPLTGLLQFKVGAGADVVELVGEHELVLDRVWHKAYELAMAARVKINERRFGRAAGEV